VWEVGWNGGCHECGAHRANAQLRRFRVGVRPNVHNNTHDEAHSCCCARGGRVIFAIVAAALLALLALLVLALLLGRPEVELVVIVVRRLLWWWRRLVVVAVVATALLALRAALLAALLAAGVEAVVVLVVSGGCLALFAAFALLLAKVKVVLIGVLGCSWSVIVSTTLLALFLILRDPGWEEGRGGGMVETSNAWHRARNRSRAESARTHLFGRLRAKIKVIVVSRWWYSLLGCAILIAGVLGGDCLSLRLPVVVLLLLTLSHCCCTQGGTRATRTELVAE
jgi:hypothetical protein